MRNCKWPIGLSLLLGLGHASANNSGQYIIRGDASAVTQRGEVLLWRSGESKMGIEEIARVPLDEGRFELQGTVDAISGAGVTIQDGDKTLVGADIIFEPGTTQIVFPADRAPEVSGARYYRQVIGVWKEDKTYAAIEKELVALSAGTNGKPSAAEWKQIRRKSVLLDRQQWDTRTRILRRVYDEGTDPVARFLALEQGAMGRDSKSEIAGLTALLGQLSDNPMVPLEIKRLQLFERKNATAAAIKVGSIVKDFTAPNLDGRTFRMSDVFKHNKYVLVEFWASWCSPCRAQIPHLKKAYQAFHGKGFEIVSFSLDEKKSVWSKSSDEEKLPWINTSDLQAFQSPVTEMFGVLGIPANYLVDRTGKVVAIGVWDDALEKKLARLLPGAG